VYVGAVATLFLFIVMMVEFRDLPSGKEDMTDLPTLEVSNFLTQGLAHAGVSFVYYLGKG
jgi:NADH:ubiquinone oxidoreductase subunit 6 (subunit J)